MNTIYFSIEDMNEAACRIAEKTGKVVYLSDATIDFNHATIPAGFDFPGIKVREGLQIESCNGGEYYHARDLGAIVTVDGKHYILWRNSAKKYGLLPVNPVSANYREKSAYECPMKAPNFIGVPTAKKIRDWALYVETYESGLAWFIANNRQTEQNEFAIIARNKGAKVETKDGKITSIVIRREGVQFTFYADCGKIYYNRELDPVGLCPIVEALRAGKL